MQTIHTELETLLKKDKRLVADGKLMKNKVIEFALKLDKDLLKLLQSNKSIKTHFFQEVDSVLVFDKVRFQDFVNLKEFLADSYTKYKSKIGLEADGDYLSKSKDVVLVWPYKDCLLEGGQTKAERENRSEIFWNETLAPEHYDRLLSPKAFTNFKKYDSKGEQDLKGKIDFGKENLIIKGNNLLALHSLKERFEGQVKLIYIDPPYNTKSDEFGYNDTFNHSAWLTFMKNRLETAKQFLKTDGVIFINIGDEEVHYLKVLSDDIFGRENFINTVARVAKTASNKGTWFAPSIDFILCYAKDKTKLPEFYDEVDESLYKKMETEGKRKGEKYRDDVALYQSSLDPLRGCNNQRYFIEAPDGTLLLPPGNIFPTKKKDGAHIEPKTREDKVWRWAFESYFKKKDLLVFKETKNSPLLDENGKQAKYNIYTKSYLTDRQEDGTKPRNYFDQFINRKGADYIKKLDIEFNYSKPVELIEHLINIVQTSKDDYILDFFAGSSTTAEAVLRVNEKDDGKRKFILCEQLDYFDTVSVPRIQKIIGKENFISCELAKDNAQYIDKIEKAKKTEELKKTWAEMQKEGFISHRIKETEVFSDEGEIKWKDLSIEEQKQILIRTLDLNHLYINYSEIEDERYKKAMDDESKKLNRQFYSKK